MKNNQSKNVLIATTLVIPKQNGTSDTCTTENEEEILLIADKEDLITLGWVSLDFIILFLVFFFIPSSSSSSHVFPGSHRKSY